MFLLPNQSANNIIIVIVATAFACWDKSISTAVFSSNATSENQT
jgi:hypothetical protein